MPAVIRKGDSCTGHDCFPPRQNVQGSGNVYVNSLPCHREGDGWEVHACTHKDMPHGVHDGAMGKGSESVYVNDKSIARVGDSVSCGSQAVGGSPNVFAGG